MPKADAPTLADRATKRAAETPAEIWKALLMAALPKRPAVTRKAAPTSPAWPGGGEHFDDAGEPRVQRQPSPFRKLEGRGRNARDRAYSPTGKRDTSRPGTFRRYMLATILSHTSTRAAVAAHVASGQYAYQTLNFSWAEKEGYITFN